jgi:hypothetical protein
MSEPLIKLGYCLPPLKLTRQRKFTLSTHIVSRESVSWGSEVIKSKRRIWNALCCQVCGPPEFVARYGIRVGIGGDRGSMYHCAHSSMNCFLAWVTRATQNWDFYTIRWYRNIDSLRSTAFSQGWWTWPNNCIVIDVEPYLMMAWRMYEHSCSYLNTNLLM